MASIDPWITIHEERRALLKDLEPLTSVADFYKGSNLSILRGRMS